LTPLNATNAFPNSPFTLYGSFRTQIA
jgi:hypothetical protein